MVFQCSLHLKNKGNIKREKGSVMKSGFVAIVGKPNVGKSTLLNRLIGEKVSIVSPKPQTTRNKILGILNEPDYQIIFIDTPGIHKSHNKLDEYMEKSIKVAQKDVDVLLLMIDGSKGIRQNDLDFVRQYEKSSQKVIVLVNKIDTTTFEKLYPDLAKLNSMSFVEDIIPISAKTGKNVDVLLNKIKSLLTDTTIYFDEDMYTDKSLRFMVAEMVREKALYLLQDEIPHGLAIEVVKMQDIDGVMHIDIDIICERKTHKMIIIGKNGSMLKEIGSRARIDIENLLGQKVYLQLFVKVKEDWRSSNYYVTDFGYDQTDL